MKVIPYEKYELDVPRSSQEVIELIREHSEPWRLGHVFGAKTKPFLGRTEGNSFKIYRAIRYQNSFLPILNGIVEDRGSESRLRISLRMPYFTSLFMLVWMGGGLLVGFATHGKFEMPEALTPWGILLFGYLLMQGGFWFEVPRAKRLLDETLGNSSQQRARGRSLCSLGPR